MKTPKIPKTVQAWLDSNKSIIDSYHTEDDGYGEDHQGDFSIWCYLKKGYINTLKQTHIIHAATAKQFLEEAKYIKKVGHERSD